MNGSIFAAAIFAANLLAGVLFVKWQTGMQRADAIATGVSAILSTFGLLLVFVTTYSTPPFIAGLALWSVFGIVFAILHKTAPPTWKSGIVESLDNIKKSSTASAEAVAKSSGMFATLYYVFLWLLTPVIAPVWMIWYAAKSTGKPAPEIHGAPTGSQQKKISWDEAVKEES